MAETFLNILTIIGQQKKTSAEAGGAAVNITHFKVGDSNGTYYTPLETQTDLVHTTYTGSFTDNSGSQIIVNPSALNEVLYKCFIPADVGGFTVRELGLFDANNDLILICKLPAQDKFALDSGLYQPLTFTPKIIYTNPVTQAVLTPSSQIIATQTFVTQQIANMNISDFSRTIQQNIIDRLAQIVSPQSIKRLIFFDETGSTTTLKDRSLNASNATLSANASTLSPVEIENCRTLNLSNSASVEFNDADDLSFTDGTNDKPFTLITLINPNAVNNGHILSKNDLTSASYKREYVFYFDAFNKLHGRIYDNASGAYLDRFFDTQITGDIGNFHTYMMTYDGSKTSTGLKLYRDGTKVDNQGVNSGSYSKMVNTAAKLGNFYVNTIKQAIGNYRGALIAVISETLSTAEIKDIDIVLRSYVGLDVPASGELTGHAFDPNAHSSLFAQKSDVGHIHDDRYYTETEIDAQFAAIKPDIYVPYSFSGGHTDANGYSDLLNPNANNTDLSFKVGGSYANAIPVFPNGHIYEISNISNITGISSNGLITPLIREDQLVKQSDGTYTATAVPVSAGYSFNGNIPALTSGSHAGYTLSYLGNKSFDPYSVFDQNGSTYNYWFGWAGGYYPYDSFSVGGNTYNNYSGYKLICTNTITISGFSYYNSPITYNTLGGSSWTHYCNNILVFVSTDGGVTWSAPTSLSLAAGANNLGFSATGNAFIFAFANYGFGVDDWDSANRWIIGIRVNDLYVIQTITAGSNNITEGLVFPSNPGVGDWHRLTSANPKLTYVWTGSQWQQVNAVRVGELLRLSNVFGTPVTFAFNKEFYTKIPCPSVHTTTPINHNIGSNIVNAAYCLVCKTAEFGYTAGEKAVPIAASSSEGSSPIGFVNKNTISFSTGNEGASGLQIMKKDNTGIYGSPTIANWDLEIFVKGN